MPDLKISDLPAAEPPADGDLAPIVQAGVTRRATMAQLRASVLAEHAVHVRDFGALGNGSADDAPAIQAAIDALKTRGGGTVRLGPREYRLATPVVVDGVTVRLQGAGFTEAGGPGDGTWLRVDQTGFTPLLFTGAVARGSQVRDLAVRQIHGAAQNAGWAPTDYPWFFRVEDCFGGVDFDNVMLAGVNRGIFVRNSGRADIRRLRGQVFRCAVEMDEIHDTPRMMNLHIWPVWSANDHVVRWQQSNGDAFVFRRVDGLFADQASVLGYRSMFRFAASAAGVTGKFSIGQAHADFVRHGVWIEGDGTDGQIHGLTTQGEIFNGGGAAMPGAVGLRVAANASRVQIGHLRIEDCEDSPVVIEGHSNRLDVFSSRFVNFNARGNGAAMFHLANAAAGQPNRVSLGAAPLVETAVPGPLLNAGTNGSVGGLAPAGSAAKPGLAVGAADAGLWQPSPGAVSLSAGGAELLRGAPLPGANTALSLRADAGAVLLGADTALADAGFTVTSKGSGLVQVATGGGVQMQVGHATAAVNALRVLGAATGNPARVGWQAAGVDANVSAVIGQPKGNGAVLAQFPDGASTGGGARGTHAVDLQLLRGGAAQIAAGAASVISGGQSNTASGTNAVVGGGSGNQASGGTSVVSGGSSCSAGGNWAVVGGGNSNHASGSNSVVGGGGGNAASGTDSWIPGGAWGTTRGLLGAGAWAAGRFGAAGDAQSGEYLLRRETADASPARLTADGLAPGAANTIALAANSAYALRLQIAAKQVGGSGDEAVWFVEALARRGANAASTIVLGQVVASRGTANAQPASAAAGPMVPSLATSGGAAAAAGQGADAWRCSVAADTSLGALAVTVTGEAGKTIRWVARILSTEVTA
ncbi:MAG: hypothetical protein K2X11_06360 [Acetobacteraceae bacterium]|nr:hypothetical protein [Acetobacteraceae bacterium]